MQLDGPNGDAPVIEGDVKIKTDKPLEQDASMAEPGPVAA